MFNEEMMLREVYSSFNLLRAEEDKNTKGKTSYWCLVETTSRNGRKYTKLVNRAKAVLRSKKIVW